jgi:hypothetical protein
MAEMGIKRVDLLPYHKLGVAKYRLLRRPYKLVAEAPSSDFLNDFKNAFVKRGDSHDHKRPLGFYDALTIGSCSKRRRRARHGAKGF